MPNKENFELNSEAPLKKILDNFLNLQSHISRIGTDEEFVNFDEVKNRIEKQISDEFDVLLILRGSIAWHKFMGSSLPDDAPERLTPAEELRVLQKLASEIANELPDLIPKES